MLLRMTVVSLAAFAAGLVGCSLTKVSCDCLSQPAGIVINAPSGAVTAIQASGVACAGAGVRCIPHDFSSTFTPGCMQYQVLPRGAGACHVEVVLSGGESHPLDVIIVDTRDQQCCGGLFASRPEDSEVTVGFADAGVDAPEAG